MFHKSTLSAYVVGLAFLATSFAPAQVTGQNPDVGPNETQESSARETASSNADGAQGKVETADSNSENQTGGEKEKPEFKVGRIIFPTYFFEMGDKKLFYGLYLPKSFDESKTYPLVVVLHGLNGSPGQILAYPGLTKHADDNNYILVAPMGYNSRGWYGSRGEGGGRGSEPRNLGELSEQDVMEVLKLTRKNFRTDPERIYLFGHSMGGGGSMHLAMKYPDIWAAIAVVAPAAYGNRDRLATAKDIPAIIVQGDQDRLVSVRETRRWVGKMKELGMKHKYIEVKNGGHVLLAWQHFDEIFEFFAEHAKNGVRNKVAE